MWRHSKKILLQIWGFQNDFSYSEEVGRDDEDGVNTEIKFRWWNFSQLSIKGAKQCLESGALDHSAILTLTVCTQKKLSSHLGIEPRTFGLEVQRAILCANGTPNVSTKILAERSFDLRTSGLWAQHASTAPLCSHGNILENKRFCQKWDSNPRPQKWTATWTQRLRPLGHPDLLLLMKQRKHATPQRLLLGLALAFTDDRHVPSIAQLVERWTVVGNRAEIHRSLVQIRLEGVHFCFDSNPA